MKFDMEKASKMVIIDTRADYIQTMADGITDVLKIQKLDNYITDDVMINYLSYFNNILFLINNPLKEK